MSNTETAIQLAAAGVSVFPCEWQGKAAKRPKISKTDGGTGFHDATTDAATVADWWKRWPDALVGVSVPAGVVVVDCDTGKVDKITGEVHDGNETLSKNGFLDLADTASLIVQTPSGGTHRYFRAPEGDIFSNTSNVNQLAAVDLRTSGSGYTIAPGSEYAAGRYTAIKGDMKGGLDAIAVMPDRLGDALKRPERPKLEAASRAGDKLVSGLHPGKGWVVNNARFRMPLCERTLLEKRLNGLLKSIAGRVATTTTGGRHHATFNAAMTLGGYLHYRAFGPDDVARELYRACEANGHMQDDGERVVLLAIRDGLRNGMAAPLALENRPKSERSAA